MTATRPEHAWFAKADDDLEIARQLLHDSAGSYNIYENQTSHLAQTASPDHLHPHYCVTDKLAIYSHHGRIHWTAAKAAESIARHSRVMVQ